MALDQHKPVLARQKYTIGASQQRVWDLLAANVVQSLPIEQMDFINETALTAVLNIKVGFIKVPTPVTVEIADISPIESFTTMVTASKGGLRSVLRVSFKLAAVTDEQTSVTCIVVEDYGSPLMRLLRWQQRHFAGKIFRTVRNRLECSC